jgi:ketosteroid isomerase-like protein
MRANATTTAEVNATLEQYRSAYVERDIDRLMAAFAPDEDTTILGTGVDELLVGYATIRTALQRDWLQSDEITWEWQTPVVSSAGPVAWALTDATVEVRMGSIRVTMPTRITAVLELRGDRWLITQMHLSAPAAGQTVGESFPPPTD